MERKTRYLIITLCCIIGIVLGTTTAWYTWTSSTNTDVTFTIGGVTVNYVAGDNITGASLRPTSDKTNADYAIQKNITVSLDEANKTALFNLYLTAEIFPEILSHESLKWEVYEEETLLNRGNFAGISQGDKLTILDQIEINNTQRNLRLYIYIDGNMENPAAMSGQTYSLLLSADATDEGTNLYKDPSGANTPELMSGMVPVEYLTTTDGVEADGWYVADETTDWYNYGEQRWANAVLVSDETLRTASAGTPVPEDSVLAYYVWIPRYSYQLFNAQKLNDNFYVDEDGMVNLIETVDHDSYNAQNTGIHINFEKGIHTTGITSCTISSSGVETCTNAVDGNYYTHPAFWWDSNDNGVREINEELTGIWVGKFEISSETPDVEYGGGSSTTLSVRVKPNVYSWSNNNVSNFSTVIQKMMNDGNEYGISNEETDSHMLKNMEWGAVTYLTHSIYGRCNGTSCTKIENNIDASYWDEYKVIAGGVNYKTNVGQSTTNNITGIYDMSAGWFEYVMGNMIYSDGATMMSGYSDTLNSGFNGIIYISGKFTSKTNGVAYPANRYYDVYSYSTDGSDYDRGHLGDATGEVVYYSDVIWNIAAWGDAGVSFTNVFSPWVARGGAIDYEEAMGTFNFYSCFGNNDPNFSTRSALVSVS